MLQRCDGGVRRPLPEPATGRDCSSSTTSVNHRGPPSMSRRDGYPWPEQMARKMLRNVEKRGVHTAGNGPSEDGKCWQRVELGIHGPRSWGRNWSRIVRETRNSGGLQSHEGGRPPC